MEALYPVALALSALIGAGLSLLLLLQRAKEAAVLRVLGAERTRVAGALCLEQGFVSLMDTALGLAALFVLFGGAPLPASALLCAGLYLGGAALGSLLAAVLILSKMPLEMLQVKE